MAHLWHSHGTLMAHQWHRIVAKDVFTLLRRQLKTQVIGTSLFKTYHSGKLIKRDIRITLSAVIIRIEMRVKKMATQALHWPTDSSKVWLKRQKNLSGHGTEIQGEIIKFFQS